MAKLDRKEMDELVVVFKDTFYSIADEFGDRVASALDDNISDFNQRVFKDVVKDFSSLAKISTDISKNTESIAVGTLKQRDIDRQIARRKAKIAGITATINTALKQGTKEYEDALRLQQDAVDANEQALELLKKQKEELRGIEKKAGVFSSLADGVKSIPGLGPILGGPFKEAAEAAKEAAVNANWFKTQLVGTKVLVQELAGLVTFGLLIKSYFNLNNESVKLQRNLQLSANSARAVRDEFDRASIGTLHLREELVAANTSFGEFIGSRGVFSKELVKDLNTLTTFVGLSTDQANKLGVITQGLGKPLGKFNEDIAESAVNFAATQGVALNTKDVLEEIANMSSTTLLNLGRNPQKLAEAVTQSRKLALNFQQLDKISSGLLDFDQSISAELEAELLTGKELNLERARYAALTGDVAMLQREIAKELPNLEEFERLAPIQREAYAKALSMSSEELGDILLKNEAITANASIANKLTTKQIRDAQTLSKIEGISFAQALTRTQETLTAQQKIERFMGKINNAFAELTTYLEPLIDSAIDITQKLAGSEFFRNLTKYTIGALLVGKALKGMIGTNPITPMWVREVGRGRTPGGGGNGPLFDKTSGRYRDPKTGRYTKPPKPGRWMGQLGKAGKYAKYGKFAKGGGILSLLGLGTDLAMNLMDDERTTGNALLKTLDQNKFMAAGAGIGALFGGVGAVPGAAIGGLIDFLVGEKAAIMDDFIIRPGQAPIKFNKGDILMGGTNLDKGGNSEKTNQLLERLIAAVERGGHVYIDGNKVGQSLVLSTYQTS